MVFSFVILHYKTYEDTIKCIQSIFNLDVPSDIETNVVIVDNASNDGSIEKVRDFLAGRSNIHIIENKLNLGFAKGNNVGYEYARNSLNSDFIVIMNNDIVVDSTDFVPRTVNIYKQDRYHLLGPDIVSLADGGHQNPTETTSTNRSFLKKEIVRYSFLLLLNRLGIYDSLKGIVSKNNDGAIESKYESESKVTNCQLHGSFIVFSPLYIQDEKYAFYPETFLYGEEAILYQHCMKKKYLTEYVSDIRVFHKEDSSTSYITKTPREKRNFVFSNIVKSRKIYLNYLKNPDSWS